ncbi:MAG: hypothetical protein RLZZ501_2436 [Pseudomonadota bacterium]
MSIRRFLASAAIAVALAPFSAVAQPAPDAPPPGPQQVRPHHPERVTPAPRHRKPPRPRPHRPAHVPPPPEAPAPMR